MSKHVTTTIRYDGPALARHEMDVVDLAPALLALAEIAKIANQKFNGDRATMRVLVNADVEQQCFQLDLSLVQSWIDSAQAFIGVANVATAKEIAEIIGFAAIPGGGLLGLYKWLYGKGEKPQTTYQSNDATGQTIINVIGDNAQITVSNKTAELAKDPRVLPHIRTVLAPLEKPDYSDFSIVEDDEPVFTIDRAEAQNIRAAAVPLVAPDDQTPFVSNIDGQVEIHTAQFKGSAQWGLWWTGRVRLMKIEDSDWLQRYQANQVPEAVPGAWLDVHIEITQPLDKAQPASFVVKSVRGVIPPEGKQGDMLDG